LFDKDQVFKAADMVCPVTFVRTKVALEELENGQVLEMRLSGGEPIQNVPRSLKDEGHKITGVTQIDDGTYLLTVVKEGLGASAAIYLAAAGVGTIGIADGDAAELSNLQRQIIHATANVGSQKSGPPRKL
jgi:TusA-related sulfurtransferase